MNLSDIRPPMQIALLRQELTISLRSAWFQGRGELALELVTHD